MNNEALAQLRDIHLPAQAGWWPPAPGWWLLFAASLLLAWLLWRWLQPRLQRWRLHRAAKQNLQNITAEWESTAELPRLLAQLSAFYRRCVVQLTPDYAGATGEAWLAHLNSLGKTDAFTRGEGRIIATARYAPAPEADAAAQLQLAQTWLNNAIGYRVASKKTPQNRLSQSTKPAVETKR